jgi:hypothetical protein
MQHQLPFAVPTVNLVQTLKVLALQYCNQSNIMNPNTRLECNTLTMNSATALMTSRNIMNPNTRLDRQRN